MFFNSACAHVYITVSVELEFVWLLKLSNLRQLKPFAWPGEVGVASNFNINLRTMSCLLFGPPNLIKLVRIEAHVA